MSKRVFIFDTTLRDGAQTQGLDFTLADKEVVIKALDSLYVDYVEAGWPGTNPIDTTLFNNPPKTKHSKLVAFGMTRKTCISASNDPNLAAVINSKVDTVCLVGKSWDFQVTTALNVSLEENQNMIHSSLSLARTKKAEIFFDAEHFFDGFRANKDYSLSCLEKAFLAKTDCVILCDTNGGTLPSTIREIFSEVKRRFPNKLLGIHCHNDTGCAVANSLVAIDAGARQVQGSLLGLGERCGNADTSTIIANLALKTDYDIGRTKDHLTKLKGINDLICERMYIKEDSSLPYVGNRAFAHKGGLHGSAVAKDPKTYEHIDPSLVGNSRNLVMSNQAGRANLFARVKDMKIDKKHLTPDNLSMILAETRKLEELGMSFDGADASLEIAIRKILDLFSPKFEIIRFRVVDERRINSQDQIVTESEATIIIRIGKVEIHKVAYGKGPVNAVDNALRNVLVQSFPKLADTRLCDYKVRILPPSKISAGTDAVTRVIIEAKDGNTTWSTVGVSNNIIEASIVALQDSYYYKLLKS